MSCTMKEQLLITSLLLFLDLHFCTSTDTISSNQSIKDGDLIVSEGNNFALGFFSTSNSSRRYIGIWYNKVSEQTVVWVANRDNPIHGNAGVLSIDNTGNLVIRDGDSAIPVWSTNVSAVAEKATFSAQLLDTGNLVLFKGDTKSDFAWQSFNYPTNTMLPYMKLGVQRRTGLNRFLTSWKSSDDPKAGEYSFKLDLNGSPQFFLNKGSTRLWRSGPWNGLKWSAVLESTTDFIFNLSYVNNHNEVTSMYTIRNESIFSRFVLNESGVVERLTWQDGNQRWVGFWSAPNDKCDYYNHCGSYGNCNPRDSGEFECTCLPGFEPRLASDWYLRDGSGGCKRKGGDGNACRNGDGFVRFDRANLPDTSGARVDMSLGWKECEEMCLGSCNCTGYARADVRGGGSGCITWYGELVDTKKVSDGGQDIYIRVDAAELAQYLKSKGFHGKKLVAILVTSVALSSIFTVFLAYWLVMKKRKDSFRGLELDGGGKNTDLPSFDLSTLIAATDNFSAANELGGGGFGTVYKGRLYNGVEIAVKRLSKSSGQGIEEFRNEVTLIAKLQHRNLVGLLGYCIQQEEKMLIYEYLPNKGLDYFLFDKVRGSQIDWKKRFQIILGIARGIIYLHQDSRLRIIHRDLKASNILLDAAMNPKISDFGMARMFGGDQIEANTRKVVGTYGYMSPEYAMQGLFSIKSDVFSFGVLLLEIISGKKNSSYYQTNSVNLIGHVWDLWKEGNALDIVDSSIEKSHKAEEVMRCIQIGLLCVQEIASDRPNMSEVAVMLCNETALPDPKQPAFIFRGIKDAKDSSVGICSVNDVTVTMVEAR